MIPAERWLYGKEPIAARGAGPRARREAQVRGVRDRLARRPPLRHASPVLGAAARAKGSEADGSGRSPMAVRAAETMTTGSEPALILSLRFLPAVSQAQSATEVKLPPVA